MECLILIPGFESCSISEYSLLLMPTLEGSALAVPGPALAAAGVWGMGWKMEGLPVHTAISLALSVSNKIN